MNPAVIDSVPIDGLDGEINEVDVIIGLEHDRTAARRCREWLGIRDRPFLMEPAVPNEGHRLAEGSRYVRGERFIGVRRHG